MISSLSATPTKHRLDIVSETRDVATIDVEHVRDAVREREHVHVVVTLHDERVDVTTEVRPS